MSESLSTEVRAMNYNVVCGIKVKNRSQFRLKYKEASLNYGLTSRPPVSIPAGSEMSMLMHKYGWTATGTSGFVSWKIGDTNDMLVIMWSVPFNQNIYSNHLGFGIFQIEDNVDFFKKMYDGQQDATFCKQKFRKCVQPMEYTKNGFKIDGVMGTAHKCDVYITFEQISMESKVEYATAPPNGYQPAYQQPPYRGLLNGI